MTCSDVQTKSDELLPYYEKLGKAIEFRAEGLPYWRTRPSRKTRVGSIAGSLTRKGHRQIETTINGARRLISAHRLLWFMAHGTLPSQLDHRNRNPDDNRIENLRPANRSENGRNRKGTGTSKYLGVSWQNRNKRWVSTISVDGRNKYLGMHKTQLEAALAYDKACRDYEIGEFANLNFPEFSGACA